MYIYTMKATVKEILTENRESVISSIKWVFKVWKAEDVKAKMIQLLAFAESNLSIEKFETCKAKKTMLKALVERMKVSTERSLEEMMADAHENETFDILKKEWVFSIPSS